MLTHPIRTKKLSPPELEAVIAGDAKFFARHTSRSYRMRLAARAEIEANARADFHMGLPLPGYRWVTVVWQVTPGGRIRAWCQLPEGMDLDAPEAVVGDLFRFLHGKADTVIGNIVAGR